MSMSGVFDSRSMVSSTQRSAPVWRRLRLWPAKRPTTFQRCLALHIAGAERAGALQSR